MFSKVLVYSFDRFEMRKSRVKSSSISSIKSKPTTNNGSITFNGYINDIQDVNYIDLHINSRSLI